MNNRVLIRTEQILEAREQISSLKQQNDELKARIERLKSSLEWQVGAKEGINDNLSSISAYLDKQSSFLENATTLCNSVVSTTDETSNSLIAAISALMLSIIGISVVTSGNYRIITDPNGNVTVSVINTGTESTDVSVIPSTNQASGNTKSYPNPSSVNYKGQDYSDFKVAACYDESKVMNQHDPRWAGEKDDKLWYTTTKEDGTVEIVKNSDGSYKNGGCSLTSEAMIHNMKHPEDNCVPTDFTSPGGKKPTGSSQSSPSYCNHNKNCNTIPGSGSGNAEVQRKLIAESVNNGEPVIVRLNNHDVVAIGIREGADPITNNDILVIDPSDGKVKTIVECKREMVTNAKLYTAK